MDRKSCFPGGTVVSHLKNNNKYKAIHELIHSAPVFRDVEDIDEFENAVLDREKVLTTGIGHGVALAHGKSRAVKKLFIALGRSPQGIDFGAPDGKPVHFLFIVANPPGLDDEYLSTVGVLSGILRDKCFRNKLLNIHSERELESTLKQAFTRAVECR